MQSVHLLSGILVTAICLAVFPLVTYLSAKKQSLGKHGTAFEIKHGVLFAAALSAFIWIVIVVNQFVPEPYKTILVIALLIVTTLLYPSGRIEQARRDRRDMDEGSRGPTA
jgi:cell division protein FtsW (lipid II flippase)